MKIKGMQIVRIVMMVLAAAGLIFALEYLKPGVAVWFWAAVLGVGFVGLLYSFRLAQKRAVSDESRQRKLLKNKRKRQ